MIAERFLLAADAAFSRLAGNASFGAPVETSHPKLAGLRKWPVAGFPNLLIFYQPIRGGVSIARVIHAARDWPGMFASGER